MSKVVLKINIPDHFWLLDGAEYSFYKTETATALLRRLAQFAATGALSRREAYPYGASPVAVTAAVNYRDVYDVAPAAAAPTVAALIEGLRDAQLLAAATPVHLDEHTYTTGPPPPAWCGQVTLTITELEKEEKQND